MKYSFPQLWEHFNYQHDEVEQNVEDRLGAYQGLAHEALYTSDDDLLLIFHHPLVEGRFLDLGCGTGRAPILYGLLFPERQSFGIEFESSRIKVGEIFTKSFNLPNITLVTGDLLSCNIPEADSYFLYFPTGAVLDRILHLLYHSQKPFKLIAIESHGDLFARLENENWLQLRAEISLSSKRHHPMARIFERVFVSRDSHPAFALSFQEKFLLIEDGQSKWIGETFFLEWSYDSRFELKTPPRTILWSQVKKVMELSEIETLYQPAIRIRRLGRVKIVTNLTEHTGFIRKIIVYPTFALELSSGEKVEWGHILTISQGTTLCYASP